ncbi:MAG: hypothetical protein HY675_14550 [Chloroflexi bacterium]|nr:hypothetical protein [Chloroflexota bacterium]
MPWKALRLLVLLIVLLAAIVAGVSPSSKAAPSAWSKLGLDGVRVNAVLVDPTNPSVVFLATNGAGVLRSTNAGQSWTAINNGLGNLFVNDLVFDPHDRSVVLAATGRDPALAELSAGVYRSANRGDIWSQHISAFAVSLAVDPANPATMFAVGSPAVLRSTNGGLVWATSFVPGSAIASLEATGVAVSPFDPRTVLVVGNSESGTGLIFRSSDGGSTWDLILGALPRLFGATFASASGSGATAFVAASTGVFRSDDAVATFARVTDSLGDIPISRMLVNPLVAGTVFGASLGQGVIRSVDAGATWGALDSSLGNRNVRGLGVDGASPQTLYAGTEDGPWAFTFAPSVSPTPTSTPTTTPTVITATLTPTPPAAGTSTPTVAATATPTPTLSPTPTVAPARSPTPTSGPALIPTPIPGVPLVPTPTPSLAGVTWLFADGSTQPPFVTWFLLQNPTGKLATVSFTFLLEGEAVVERFLEVPPTSRVTILANDLVPDRVFSTHVIADQQIFAERAMYVNLEGRSIAGLPAPSRIWLFADGSTQPPFQTRLVLENPNAEPAPTSITYFLEGGEAVVQRLGKLPPLSRTSILVNDVLPEAVFSIRVGADLPIVAERVVKISPGSNLATGVVGVHRASKTWFFAEGRSTLRGIDADTFLSLFNPNENAVTATIRLFSTDGTVRTLTRTLEPLSRATEQLNLVFSGEFGIAVEATGEIVAERSVFFGEEPRSGYATQGAQDLGTVWNLPEGSTAPPFDEILAVLNPRDQPLNIRAEFQLESGEVIARDFAVGPNRKLDILVDDIVPSAAVATRVIASAPTVVERIMLISNDTLGATNSIGMRQQ